MDKQVTRDELYQLLQEEDYNTLIPTLIKMDHGLNHAVRLDFFDSINPYQVGHIWIKIAKISDDEYRERFGHWRHNEHHDVFKEMEWAIRKNCRDDFTWWITLVVLRGPYYLIEYLSKKIYDKDKSIGSFIEAFDFVKSLSPEEKEKIWKYIEKSLPETAPELNPERITMLFLMENLKRDRHFNK